MVDAMVGSGSTGMYAQDGRARFNMSRRLLYGSFHIIDLLRRPWGNVLSRFQHEIKTGRSDLIQQANMLDIAFEHGKQNANQAVTTTKVGHGFTPNSFPNTRVELKALKHFFKRHGSPLAQGTREDGREVVAGEPACVRFAKFVTA